MACPWVKGLPAPLGWQRIVPLKVWRQSGFAVKCPPGGLGERLLVDLAELNFHVCTWTEHPEAHLLQHVPELLTAYRYAQSSPSPAFAMRPPPSADSERETPLTYWFRATAHFLVWFISMDFIHGFLEAVELFPLFALGSGSELLGALTVFSGSWKIWSSKSLFIMVFWSASFLTVHVTPVPVAAYFRGSSSYFAEFSQVLCYETVKISSIFYLSQTRS